MKKITYIFLIFTLLTAIKSYCGIGYLDSLISGQPDSIKIAKLEKFISEEDSLPRIIEAKHVLMSLYKKNGDINKWFETVLSLADNYENVDFFKVVKTLKNAEKELTTTYKNDTLLSELYKKLGRVYEGKSDYDKAGKYYLKSLRLKQKINDKKGIASALNSLGLIYYYQGNYDLALKNFSEALPLVEELNFQYGIASILSNMAIIYLYKEQLDTALQIYEKVLNIRKKLNDRYHLSVTYNNIGLIYQKQKKYNKAAFYFKKSLDIKKEIGDKTGEASTYINLAMLFIEKEEFQRALQYLKKAEKIAEAQGDRKLLKNIYNDLATVYEKLKDYEKAFKYEEKYVEIKDSLITEEMQKQLLTLQTKYETEQKEQQIKMQKIKLAKAEAENKQKELKLEKEKFIRIVFSVGIVLLLFVLVFIYFNYRQKRQLSEKLARQNQVIQTKNEKLNQLVTEIEKQKQRIEQIHKELSESIDYAKRLQTSILPDFAILEKNVEDYFILFRPRDKVSGDFYWWSHVENHTIITVADCTGHGVPGAFMSMLGMSFLREIVEKEYITHPGIILKRLRKEIIKALKQRGVPGEQKDGMDMSLISINHEKGTVSFAGANNPVYVVTTNELEILTIPKNPVKKVTGENTGEFVLYELKPDKMPIAIYERMDNFATVEFRINKGEQIYMFSDGYADQFGGPKGKKFKYKALKQMFITNASLPMDQQKQILEKTFDEWIKGYEQIDDVTILGIKI